MPESDHPQWRMDMISGRMVIVAPGRQARPHSHGDSDSDFDPFQEGNESETPPEVMAVRNDDSEPNGPGWQIRVVPNRFAAVTAFDPDSPGYGYNPDGFHDAINSASVPTSVMGIHDVIIECPHFESCLSRLPIDHVERLFVVYRDRFRMLKQNRRIAGALLFKNKGAVAGASLGHAHSQIIATEIVPSAIQTEMRQCKRTFESFKTDPFQQMLDDCIARDLVVAETNDVIAVCPAAARFPFEVWIIPRQHHCRFEDANESASRQAGQLMHRVLVKLNQIHDDPPYNFVLHSLPFRLAEPVPWYRWHFELYPRLAGVAGYELGAECFINPVIPEVAAQQLRDA